MDPSSDGWDKGRLSDPYDGLFHEQGDGRLEPEPRLLETVIDRGLVGPDRRDDAMSLRPPIRVRAEITPRPYSTSDAVSASGRARILR